MKSKVIDAIKELNILKLEKLLPNNQTYMNVSKTLFLKQLNEVFKEVKKKKRMF